MCCRALLFPREVELPISPVGTERRHDDCGTLFVTESHIIVTKQAMRYRNVAERVRHALIDNADTSGWLQVVAEITPCPLAGPALHLPLGLVGPPDTPPVEKVNDGALGLR